jgi:putative thioredoxin
MSDHSPNIIEATPETFQRDVIDRSHEVPVLVDFWAAWCGPCRLLGPVLERLANEYEGQFVLAKADTERLPEIAAEFGVRSIPAVYGLRDGRVVDGFVGVQPEAAIRAFINRLVPSPAEALVAEARGLEATDPRTAEAKYRQALELSATEPLAKIGLARLLLTQDRVEEARALIDVLGRRGFLEPEAERLKAELDLRDRARGVGGVEAARAAVAAHPDDLGCKLKLAEALAAAGQYPEALEIGLDLVGRDRRGVGEEARKTMLAIFQLLPQDSELVGEYRRKLSLVL